MRLRDVLAVLAIGVCFFGCQSEREEAVPDELIGVWKTSAPGYEDNFLELRQDEIVFGAGPAESNINSIYRVETAHPLAEKTILITIYYTDDEGKGNAASIYYYQGGTRSIRFEHQMQIEWRLVEQRPARKGSLARRRPAGSSGKGSNLRIALALLGMALTAGAALWRLRQSRLGELAPAVENVEAGSARQMGGDRESRKMRVAEGGTDWTQAPTKVPAIVAKEHRRSERMLLKIPVHVAGIDVHGKSFEERTFTLSISRYGACIWLRNSPRQGDPVTVTNMGTRQSCVFRLCESGTDPSGEVTGWGIECLEPHYNFWQIRFPDKPPEPSPQENITALVVCATCHSREVAELSVAQYQYMLERGSMKRDCPDCGAATEWKFILVEMGTAATPEETSAVSLPSGEEKRREKRILAKLPIRLRHPEDGRIESTLTENVSKSGVCCAASMELNVDNVILLTFEYGAGPSEDENPARIMWRRSMGKNRKTLYGIRLERKEL